MGRPALCLILASFVLAQMEEVTGAVRNLAGQSPQRRALLLGRGVPFGVAPVLKPIGRGFLGFLWIKFVIHVRTIRLTTESQPGPSVTAPTWVSPNRQCHCSLVSSVLHRTYRSSASVSKDLVKSTHEIRPRENHLLAALSDREFDRIAPMLEPVRLPRPTELEAANDPIKFVYFPTSGVASILAIDAGGETVDTAMIGREGMTGLAVFLGTGQTPMRTIVQVPLTGVRLRSELLRAELERAGRLVALLQAHVQVVMVTMAQLILCNRSHRLDQRAARWLLQVDARVEEAPFRVTQEFLAQMIGAQRPALSVAMRQFKDAGLVSYSRGQISIADREGLLQRSCGCIRIIDAETERLRETLQP